MCVNMQVCGRDHEYEQDAIGKKEGMCIISSGWYLILHDYYKSSFCGQIKSSAWYDIES